jgi:two-component system phosphate regulon sensor histidine kinase PhoR
MHPKTQMAILLAVITAATSAAALGAGPLLIGLCITATALACAAIAARLPGGMAWVAGPPGTGAGGASGPAETGLALLGDLPLALILLDRGARVLFSNGAANDLFGPVPDGEPLASIVRARALAEAVATVSDGGDATRIEFTHMRARAQRVLLAHVRPVAVRLARAEAAIMVVIEDHTRLARVEQMRRDFIANASHELKTPLASIAGFIETLQGPARDDPRATERFLPIMAQQAERMKRLVQDLMSLNRIEMNEHVRPSGRVDLHGLLYETAAALGPLAEAAGVRVEIDLPGTAIEVTGERDELSQLFVNLIDNAIKYGGSGGVVRIHLAPGEPGRRQMAGISVTDLGPGIAREHIPRLTERFYRVIEPRGKATSGTGLGLSIVKHILNRHRGDLTIRAAPGEGASFTAWLPRAVESEPVGPT